MAGRITAALADAGLGEEGDGFAGSFEHVVFSWLAGNGDLRAKSVRLLRWFDEVLEESGLTPERCDGYRGMVLTNLAGPRRYPGLDGSR